MVKPGPSEDFGRRERIEQLAATPAPRQVRDWSGVPLLTSWWRSSLNGPVPGPSRENDAHSPSMRKNAEQHLLEAVMPLPGVSMRLELARYY
jgi:hypothetical protein